MGGIFGNGDIEQFGEHRAENAGHGQGAQEGPADAEKGTPIAGVQVFLDEREPEIAHLPYALEIIEAIGKDTIHGASLLSANLGKIDRTTVADQVTNTSSE